MVEVIKVFDEKLYDQAEKIAHGHFWYSDVPNIKKECYEYIDKNWYTHGINKLTPDVLLAEYVALICKFAIQAELKDISRQLDV